MDRIYRKSELEFALLWIGIYVISMGIADDLSAAAGMAKLVTLPVCIGLIAVMVRFLRRSGLTGAFGLCRGTGTPGDYLWFLPILLLLSVNLWNGIRLDTPLPETVLFVLSMFCVGFLEEILFRGFLFRALLRDNVKTAILISSLTFGIGHLVNLLSGSPILATLLQIAYASAIGFLFTVIFYRSGSLWPCILAHGAFNALSMFGRPYASAVAEIGASLALCVLSLSYAWWILRKTGH